jgi:hypothetical protein
VSLRVPVLLLSLLLPLGLVAGCSEDEPKAATGPGLPSQADLKSYFEAITGADVDELTRVQTDIAADGSLAQGYAAYDAEFFSAAEAAGKPAQPSKVEEVDGGFKACIGDSSDQCATWTDLHGKDGKLTDFDVNGVDLSDLLVDLTGQPPVESAGLYTVQPGYAYRQPKSGMLFVLCTVNASDVPLSPDRGTYIEGDVILKGTEAPSPETIDAGTSSAVILIFPDAQDVELSGQITFNLKLGGEATESIGFGLTDPAA